eukprot:gnl/Chilomastix_cuspidata/5497.p1 GENE.gnl/Chilomastix_cuspidata/5497~~gnl/Chilomastix_cuspidata/5497.p1  ORF type:complete len:189 (-),score=24.81 gnl/Chilomastix_cuspidata/5497:72-638(-)
MGKAASRLVVRVLWGGNVRILMTGPYSAGKQTILRQLVPEHAIAPPQVIGLQLTRAEYRGLLFTTWNSDMVGRVRPLLRHLCVDAQVIVFVLDATDTDAARIERAREELHYTAQLETLRDVVILVLANKQDLPHAMMLDQVAAILDLDALHDHQCFVRGCCARTGEGLQEAFNEVIAIVRAAPLHPNE